MSAYATHTASRYLLGPFSARHADNRGISSMLEVDVRAYSQLRLLTQSMLGVQQVLRSCGRAVQATSLMSAYGRRKRPQE